MVPSSLKISTIQPAGSNPAKRAKSMAASVCPALRKTPSGCAFSGNICPGFPNSSGLVFGSINACKVLALSCADIPVVQPFPIKSTETVKGVSCKVVLSVTINSNCSSRQRESMSGAQINPRPSFDIKLIISGVTLRAAVKKSPSFSRSSSSTTMIIFPFFISSMASSMVLNIF